MLVFTQSSSEYICMWKSSQYTLCAKTSTFYFLHNSQKLTDLNTFWYVKF